MDRFTGGCLCGDVRLVASGRPYRVGLCHCLDCRKHHGALFHASALFPRDAVTIDGELVLGQFNGRPACIRIPFGTGVCGAAAETLQVQRIEDVHAFPGHIACDAASASELVVPIVRDGQLIAVLDIDSPMPARFTEEDEAGCVALCELLAKIL